MAALDTDGIVSVEDRARLIPDEEAAPPASAIVVPAAGPSAARRASRGARAADPLDELTGCWAGPLCHPKSLLHRMIALALMCFLGFGSYFCYDNPGALQNEIKDAMDVNTYEFSNLYAWYSWPNVALPVIGGYLMDSVFGIRLGTIIFATIIIGGQFLFGLGALIQSFSLMQVGRFVFGIGGESLAVAQNTYAVSWFKGKELNMVFGFQLSIARVGSTVNFLVVGPLYNLIENGGKTETEPHVALGWTLLIAGSTCVLSLLCALILGFMDKRAEVLLKKGSSIGGEDVVKLSDILEFPLSFWLLSVVCLAYYVAIFPFISLGQVFFMKKFALTPHSANFITGLIYLISAFASPAFGILIDKTGRNMLYVFVAIVATMVGHACLAFTYLNPYVPIVLIGLAYSLLASALWPIAALIIPEYQLGTAYGFMQAIQNLGMALITMMSGWVVDKMGYLWLEYFFIFWLAIALMCTLVIWVMDFYGSGYLNMGIEQREAHDEEVKRREKRKQAEELRERNERRVAELMKPLTVGQIRNRYLSRIGAQLPAHLGHARLIRNEVTPQNTPFSPSSMTPSLPPIQDDILS